MLVVGRGVRTLEQHVSLISPTDNKITSWPTAVCVCVCVCVCVWKGYIPKMTASRHLIGKDSLIISLAVSINLEGEEDEEEMKRRKDGRMSEFEGRKRKEEVKK